MELKSMKLDKSEKETYAKEGIVSDRPEYPWGLSIRLDNDALKKVGIVALPAVGEKMQLMARVEVVSVSQRDSKDGEKHKDVQLQITDMALAADEQKKEHSETLYGQK